MTGTAPAGELGYVFWHAPAAADPSGYGGDLARWHDALAARRPDGLVRSWTWRMSRPPWLGGWPDMVHLDVYLVRSFATLGLLDGVAVGPGTRGAHDLLASRSVHGSGGVMALAADRGPASGPVSLAFYDKERGRPYPEWLDALAGSGRSVWIRRMVLGVGPEAMVVAAPDAPAAVGAVWSTAAEEAARAGAA